MDWADTSLKELIVHPNGTARSSPTILRVEPFKADANQTSREPSGLLDYWYVISAGLPLIVMIVVVGIALASFWSLWQEPVYQARLTLEIQHCPIRAAEEPRPVRPGGQRARTARTVCALPAAR